jgi:hypothetical protein
MVKRLHRLYLIHIHQQFAPANTGHFDEFHIVLSRYKTTARTVSFLPGFLPHYCESVISFSSSEWLSLDSLLRESPSR